MPVRVSHIMKLYNDASVIEKSKVMNLYEALLDDERNYEKSFYDKLEDIMELGASYKITFERL